MRGLLLQAASQDLGVVLVLLFFGLFVALIYSVYRAAARDELKRASMLPFEDK